MVRVEHEAKEHQAAEERLQEEAEKILLEEEERLKVLEEDRMRKEEEQRLKMMEDEKRRQEENKQLKQTEEKQKAQSVQLMTDHTAVKQESGNICESQQNSQHKAESLSKQQQPGKVKFDEENRLHEQLKMLQEQALKQKENEQNQKVGKGTSFTIDNSLTDSEMLKKKHKQKFTVTKEPEKQLQEQKQFVQEEHNVGVSKKQENTGVHQNNRKPDKQVQDVSRKEAEKVEESSKKMDKVKVKQEQRDNEILPQDNITSLEKKNFTRSNDSAVEKYDSTVQVSPEASRDMKLQLSINFTENNVKYEHSQSALQNEAGSHTSSNVATRAQKPNAAQYQAKKSTCKEPSNVWEKTVEAKRLKWMQQCESWRYIVTGFSSFV